MRTRSVVGSALMLAVVLLVAGAADARGSVLSLRWRVISHSLSGLPSLAADSSYVAFRSAGADGIVLIDERTGRRRVITPPGFGCGDLVFGGPWLMCSPGEGSAWLYNLQRRHWVFVAGTCRGEDCAPIAIGTRWVKEYAVSHGPGVGPPPPPDISLVNIKTGRVKADPATTGGTAFEDLNSPSGQRPLCSPLRYPDGGGQAGFFGPFLGFFGQFAVVDQGGVAHLERCHSHLDMPLGVPVTYTGVAATLTASTNAVVWSPEHQQGDVGPYSLDGVFLPSLRHFTVRLPPELAAGIWEIAISRRTLYVHTSRNRLWTAELPPHH